MKDRRTRFVDEYLIDLNAKEAATRAGYSKRCAHNSGPQLLRHSEVAGAVREAMAARARRTDISAERVLRELARIAFADPRDCFAWGPAGLRLAPSHCLCDDAALAVAAVRESRTESGRVTTTVKLHDKIAALEKLGRHLGLFKNPGGPDVTELPELTITIVHPPEAPPRRDFRGSDPTRESPSISRPLPKSSRPDPGLNPGGEPGSISKPAPWRPDQVRHDDEVGSDPGV